MKKIKIGALLLTTLLALTACEDDREKMQFEFFSTIEQMQSDNNTKVRLVNEEWIYWEPNDKISISSNTWSGVPSMGYLTGSGGQYEDYNGTFLSELTWDSKYFVGLHPYSDQNVITYSGSKADFSEIKLMVPTTQGYRNDVSFATDVIPMVAWYGGEWDDQPHSEAYNLNFRAMAAIVRLQFYNATEAQHNIDSITVEEVSDTPKPLTGRFKVLNYKTYDPYLEKFDNLGYQITLKMPDGGLPFLKDSLRSFYLVLPAVAHRDVTTDYKLRVTVHTNDGHFTKDVSVHTRRNGITYLRAIGITSLTGDVWNVEGGLVGNGTEERPFKIYTLADLTHLRNCFNNPRSDGNVYINGQKVTANTWFRIMRSDIVLRKSTWTTGIKNFTGHMTYYSNAARATHGITNRSYVPLFNSIGVNGHVKGLAIITDSLINLNTDAPADTLDYSPLCHTNYGTIENCRNISTSSSPLSDDNKRFYGKPGGVSNFAGICVENKSTGTIIGSDCGVARIMHNQSHFAGICKRNLGTIQGCILSSPAFIAGSGGNRGGICLNNEGTVQDCYTDINYNNFNDGVNWGGIVYYNMNGASHIVKNCYVSANAILRANGNVGGIVCINGGIVDNCRMESYALSGNNVGGIVATLTGGEVRNSYVNDSTLFITLRPVSGAHYAGGIVAVQSGGTISNSFALLRHVVLNSSDASGKYGTLVGRMTTTTSTVSNCYALEVDASTPQFYGEKVNGTLTNCHLVGAEQDGLDGITTVNNASLDALLNTLNANRGTNGNEWTRGNITSSDHRAPSLKEPNAAKRRHR